MFIDLSSSSHSNSLRLELFTNVIKFGGAVNATYKNIRIHLSISTNSSHARWWKVRALSVPIPKTAQKVVGPRSRDRPLSMRVVFGVVGSFLSLFSLAEESAREMDGLKRANGLPAAAARRRASDKQNKTLKIANHRFPTND